jgi:hypothetical protein
MYIVDLHLYIALTVAYAQDVDYFFIVLLLQICMLQDGQDDGLTHKVSTSSTYCRLA